MIIFYILFLQFLGRILELIEKFNVILNEICDIKYVRNPDMELIALKVEEIRSMNVSEIYTKIVIDYLDV